MSKKVIFSSLLFVFHISLYSMKRELVSSKSSVQRKRKSFRRNTIEFVRVSNQTELQQKMLAAGLETFVNETDMVERLGGRTFSFMGLHKCINDECEQYISKTCKEFAENFKDCGVENEEVSLLEVVRDLASDCGENCDENLLKDLFGDEYVTKKRVTRVEVLRSILCTFMGVHKCALYNILLKDYR